MKRDWLIVVAMGVLAIALGSPVRADDPAKESRSIEDPARVRPPGEKAESARDAGGTAKKGELSGRVVKADSKTLYLEHMGAIVPMKIDEETEFVSEGLSSSRDLTEGQEVLASFTVEKETTNVADRISLASASERVPPETGSEGTSRGDTERLPERLPVPPERGQGLPPDRHPAPRDPGSPTPSDPGVPPVPKY